MPAEVGSHFRCGIGIVYLSAYSLNHILEEHTDVQMLDLLLLPTMLRAGGR